MRRWQEIKLRQHRLKAEQEAQIPSHQMEQIMKSGFSISDIKGLQRNYSEDAVESDEVMKTTSRTKSVRGPPRPPRKGSLSRPVQNGFDENGKNETCARFFELTMSFSRFNRWRN